MDSKGFMSFSQLIATTPQPHNQLTPGHILIPYFFKINSYFRQKRKTRPGDLGRGSLYLGLKQPDQEAEVKNV
jgi:hypothetical protein